MPDPAKHHSHGACRALSSASGVARWPVGIAFALVGLVGVLAALALPFAPVVTGQTTVVWPAPGHPVVSSTALFVPYRPAELIVTVPCSAIRAAADQDHAVTVLATGPDGEGLVLRTEGGRARLQLGPRVVSTVAVAAGDCRTQVHAGTAGTSITVGNAQTIRLPGEPVPEVFAFHTDLDSRQAAGMTVNATTSSPFATSPGGMKILLVAAQLLAVLAALGLLIRSQRAAAGSGGGRADAVAGWRRTAWIDIGVIGVLCGWAIIGPLTDDDGFAATIARNAALTGNVGNYYRWWNASETPFAFTEQLLAPLTQISVAPLWLRLPSTVLGIATWLVLSRGVLGAALPATSSSVRIRLLAAVFLLAAWLPYNLGVRPEPYVAFGVTAVLALLWRARGVAGVGWAALVTALTIPVSPGAVLVLAPIVVFAPRVVRIVRDAARSRAELVATVLLLCCIAAASLTVIFADQTWQGVVTATHWHDYFGPSLPWYREPERYQYLLGGDQDGSATKRVPVLLTLALLPVAGVLLLRRTEAGGADRAVARLAWVVATALVLLWLTPSKWSHYFGGLAGLFAAFLVVAVALLQRRARAPLADRTTQAIGLVTAALVALAAGLSFAGANSWWQPAVYDVPWATGPVRPLGLPLDFPLLWIGVTLAVLAARRPVSVVARYHARHHSQVVHAPVGLAVTMAGIAVAVLLGSFLAAPVRRTAGSLAMVNLHRLTGGPPCGLADSIEVLPDGAVLPLAPAPRPNPTSSREGQLSGFTALGGFDPASPPPDPPGTGMSAQLWGSRVGEADSEGAQRRGALSRGALTSPWFALPPLSPTSGVAVSVSGRTDRGNKLILEFGRSVTGNVAILGNRTPFDRVRHNQDDFTGAPDYRQWRSIGLDAAQIPAGADRVRVHAIDNTTDPDGWLAVTGPRLRSVVGLTTFLAHRGPVLVSWPQAFLFPCVHNIVRVGGGLAGAPRVVIEAPRRHGRLSAITTDQSQGGDFAAIRPFGRLYEVPTRLAGHPEIDWGALQLSADPSARDAYQRTSVPRHGDMSGSDRVR